MGSGNTTAIPAQIVCMMKHSGLLGADQRFKHGPLLRSVAASAVAGSAVFLQKCLSYDFLASSRDKEAPERTAILLRRWGTDR